MNSRLLIISLIGGVLFSYEVTAAELENTGKDCWRNCNRQQGPCNWCGSKGFCCTKKDNWTDTSFGCDGSFGGETRHECDLKLDQGPYCATEGQICECHGKVKYGRDDSWTAEKDVKGSINCTNDVFGDPKPFFKKECLCTPMAELENTGKDCWRKCNRQQGPCDWCGSKGFCCTQKDNWTDTSFGCDGSFGGETRHECALKLDQGPYCATEGEICKCHGKVKYGRHESWTAERDVNGSINCTNDVFGDPKPYFKKECLCTPMVATVCDAGDKGTGGVCNCTNAPGWTEGNWWKPWCHQGMCLTGMKLPYEECFGKLNGTGLGDGTWCWDEKRNTRCPTIPA